MNTKVSFRIRRGSKYSGNATYLVINQPLVKLQKNPVYSCTQPFKPNGSVPDCGEGWDLSTDQITEVRANHSKQPTSIVTYLEFDIDFTQAGSFFIQIVYKPENDKVHYSVPNYVNVEP